jgi:glutamate/tyrosine decarboxylase-like PLP-dependent enzyme
MSEPGSGGAPSSNPPSAIHHPQSTSPLAHFLGPKSENAPLFEELLLEITRDYLHWRRNYFPGDPILISRAMQREHVEEHDTLIQHVHTMLAELRRNFPFYSPRYLAHQLSDTTMPSMLGYFAGMLFNPNNVTPGAAPVTTEMEILACNEVLRMLGFTPPPEPPGETRSPAATSNAPPPTSIEDYYRRAGETEYGWAHLTSGGTVANIEALWAARQVRYAPLSIKSVARDLGLNIPVTLANGARVDIQRAADHDLLLVRTREAIDLLPRYIAALKTRDGYETLGGPELGRAAWRLLHEAPTSLARGTGTLFAQHPPVILVAGSRHYSIAKAADIIGVGAANVVRIDTDEHFRLDPTDLRTKLASALYQGRVPLAVIATAGTTEEGSIDPIDRIVEVRKTLEAHHNASFWLHADAAWGGYLRCLFRPSDTKSGQESIVFDSAIEETQHFVSEQINGSQLRWPADEVGRALVSLADADSITIDPHKLGYGPYPAGCVAFRNDRVRLFLQQRSPYISATTPDPLIPVPPRHARIDPGSGSDIRHPTSDILIDSFSPFILEGSRPGAAATALWLSIQSIPLTREGHGRILRESLLAARWFFECLSHELAIPDLQFIPLTPGPPDTSIVTFTIKRRSSTSLAAMNALTQAVHDRFSIQSELGERRYSYSQPFFLSSTHMEPGEYPAATLEPFFTRAGLHGFGHDYEARGLAVLRASVMSPYLGFSRTLAGQDFAQLFVRELAQAAHEELASGRARVHDHAPQASHVPQAATDPHAHAAHQGRFPIHPHRHGDDNGR